MHDFQTTIIDLVRYLKCNIHWIKDVGMLVFAGVGTVVTILTYRRARDTILQPIRNEVIKKQSELLSNILNDLPKNESLFIEAVDYQRLVAVNVFLLLNDYGFTMKEHKEIEESMRKDVGGWFPCGESEVLEDVELISTFESNKESEIKSDKNYGRERFERAKNGEIIIDKIYFTRKHIEFIEKLSKEMGNPFMPQKLQEILKQLIIQVRANLTGPLKIVLENFMKEFCQNYFVEKKVSKFNPIGVYNNFNHSRVHHVRILNDFRKQIREYLLIDKP